MKCIKKSQSMRSRALKQATETLKPPSKRHWTRLCGGIITIWVRRVRTGMHQDPKTLSIIFSPWLAFPSGASSFRASIFEGLRIRKDKKRFSGTFTISDHLFTMEDVRKTSWKKPYTYQALPLSFGCSSYHHFLTKTARAWDTLQCAQKLNLRCSSRDCTAQGTTWTHWALLPWSGMLWVVA